MTTPDPLAPPVARSQAASATAAVMVIAPSRRGWSRRPASPVAAPMQSASIVAQTPMPATLRRCSSASAPNNSASTPNGRRETTPMAIADPASDAVSVGPTAARSPGARKATPPPSLDQAYAASFAAR